MTDKLYNYISTVSNILVNVHRPTFPPAAHRKQITGGSSWLALIVANNELNIQYNTGYVRALFLYLCRYNKPHNYISTVSNIRVTAAIPPRCSRLLPFPPAAIAA